MPAERVAAWKVDLRVCHQVRRQLPCDLDAPQQARELCREHLAVVLGHGSEAEATIEDAVSVLTELVSNAVSAGCGDVIVEIDLHHDHMRISVEDDAGGEPKLQRPGARDAHGRGLQIVDRIAQSWGASPDYIGKQVWAILPVSRYLTDGMHCTVTSLF
jgi:hypothetical protein